MSCLLRGRSISAKAAAKGTIKHIKKQRCGQCRIDNQWLLLALASSRRMSCVIAVFIIHIIKFVCLALQVYGQSPESVYACYYLAVRGKGSNSVPEALLYERTEFSSKNPLC